MNSIWFVSTAKKIYEKTLKIGSRPQTKTSSPNGRDHSTMQKFQPRDVSFPNLEIAPSPTPPCR